MADLRILVTEDESIVAADIRSMLNRYNVCSTAFRGNDAVEKTVEDKPGLVLMDIRFKEDTDE